MSAVRIRLKLPDGFRSAQLESNWSDMFVGLPRDTEWEVEPETEEELGWLLADFLALHSGVICEAAGVADFELIENPGDYVEITPIDP